MSSLQLGEEFQALSHVSCLRDGIRESRLLTQDCPPTAAPSWGLWWWWGSQSNWLVAKAIGLSLSSKAEQSVKHSGCLYKQMHSRVQTESSCTHVCMYVHTDGYGETEMRTIVCSDTSLARQQDKFSMAEHSLVKPCYFTLSLLRHAMRTFSRYAYTLGPCNIK